MVLSPTVLYPALSMALPIISLATVSNSSFDCSSTYSYTIMSNLWGFAGELRDFCGVLGIDVFSGEPEVANFWDWRFGMFFGMFSAMRIIRVQANENFESRYQTTIALNHIKDLEPMRKILVLTERPLSHSAAREPNFGFLGS